MQRMINHPEPLPRCAAGHVSRHMHDLRAAHAGGGHFIECACSHSARHGAYLPALADWARMHGRLAPERARVVPIRGAR